MLPRLRRHLAVLGTTAAVALTAVAAAQAETVVRQDAAGRSITFDVLAPAVDVDWYATVLAGAAHGDEISNVTIRIVPPSEIRSLCGSGAEACWNERRGASTITVPAGRSDRLAATLLHEYGHHLDSAWPVAGVRELNGTPVWWASRGMAALLSDGLVARDYSLGWSRSVGEIFAEDYAYLHTGGYYSIGWLQPPDEALRAALLAELGGTATPPPATPPTAEPPAQPARVVVVPRRGTLRAGSRTTIPFRLLGPGRRVTVSAAVAAVPRARAGARIEVACDGATARTAAVGRGRTATLDLPNLGPADCEASLVSTSTVRQRYALRLRLAVESAAGRR